MTDWTNITPVLPGQYWFVGDPFPDRRTERVELHYVSIRCNGKSIFYISGGAFIDNKKGLWLKVELPTLPDGLTVRIA